MPKSSVRNVAFTGLVLALGLTLPFLTAQIPALGQRLLPMHLPILLGGFVLGGPLAGLVGLILPVFRSLLFGMPPIFPTGVAMSFELGTYGFLTGSLYSIFPRRSAFVYLNLIVSMLGGRVVWGVVSLVLFGLRGNSFTWKAFLASAFANAMPGIILQIILIPVLVMALESSNRVGR